jgi:RimJ/RimL family protein N-acetyltransferase
MNVQDAEQHIAKEIAIHLIVYRIKIILLRKCYNMTFHNIETKRLVLREFDKGDFLSVHSYASDPEVSKYQPWGPNSEADTKTFLEESIKYQLDNPRYSYEIAVVRKEDKKLIGACSIYVSSPKNREGGIGYCYNQEYWGNGYASEAAEAIIEFGFEYLKFHRGIVWITISLLGEQQKRLAFNF